MKRTNDEIANIIDEPLDVKNYPCHSQSVECMVKVVSDAGVESKKRWIYYTE